MPRRPVPQGRSSRRAFLEKGQVLPVITHHPVPRAARAQPPRRQPHPAAAADGPMLSAMCARQLRRDENLSGNFSIPGHTRTV
ncbi:protein of unknown function [Rhodovastum atsumiense]|nr:protein of unknown function [Rhodovastum atsumiense]